MATWFEVAAKASHVVTAICAVGTLWFAWRKYQRLRTR